MENKSTTKFTPQQWVLVREYDGEDWSLAQFSHEFNDAYVVAGGLRWRQCIPYEGNEKLRGTTDEYKEPYRPKDGDIVLSGWNDKHGEAGCQWIAIVKRGNAKSYESYCGVEWKKEGQNYKLWTESEWCDSQEYTRPATDDEKAVLMSFLHKKGKDWDAENKQLVEFEKTYKPKDGEFVHCKIRNGNECIFIKRNGTEITTCYVIFDIDRTRIVLDFALACTDRYIESIRPATEKERQLLLDALHKAVKDWDEKKKQVVDLKWQPEDGEPFYFPYFNAKEGKFIVSGGAWRNDVVSKFIRKYGTRTKDKCQEYCNGFNQAIDNIN